MDTPKQPSTILKIRTFSDDIKRAGGIPTQTPPTSQTEAPIPPQREALLPLNSDIPAVQTQVAETPPPKKVLPRTPTAFVLNDTGVDFQGASSGITLLKSSGEEVVPRPPVKKAPEEMPLQEDTATILHERLVGEKESPWAPLLSWWNTFYSSFQDLSKTLASQIEREETPIQENETPTAPTSPPSPSVQSPIVAGYSIPPQNIPIEPVGWRRISEPRENTPLSTTSEEERAAYRETLRESLPVRTETKMSIKEQRPVRTIPENNPVLQEAPPETNTPSETTSISPYARLQRLSQEQPQEEILDRDIPFIPPTPLDTPTASLRTYRNDALTDVQTKELSREKIAGIERERRDRTGIILPTTTQSSSRFPLFLTLGFCVLLLGVGGTAWYLSRSHTTVSNTPAIYTSALFISEKEVSIPLGSDRLALLQALSNARRETTLSGNETAHLHITTQEGVSAQAPDILRVLDIKAPGTFIRTVGDTLMVGSIGKEQAPFIIIKVRNFESAFAGMLEWEKNMSIDLAPLFGDPVRRTYDQAALTDDHTRPAFFVDDVLRNTNVRILYNEIGEERLLYAFANPETIIITSSHTALTALMDRLR